MKIDGALVNNELLSTIVVGFLICCLIFYAVTTFSLIVVALIDKLYERHKKKKTC